MPSFNDFRIKTKLLLLVVVAAVADEDACVLKRRAAPIKLPLQVDVIIAETTTVADRNRNLAGGKTVSHQPPPM